MLREAQNFPKRSFNQYKINFNPLPQSFNVLNNTFGCTELELFYHGVVLASTTFFTVLVIMFIGFEADSGKEADNKKG